MLLDALLTWALVAISLANTILLLWLGVTLILNADRRSWGVGITAAGFLLGSLFFISHAALLLSDSLTFTRSTTLWLAVGIVPVVILPLVWYVVTLWYAGYWTKPPGPLRSRHRLWLGLAAAAAAVGLCGAALLGMPYVPLIREAMPLVAPLRAIVKAPLAGSGIPWVALAYPLYALLCIALSLDALRRPGSTERLLGDLARRRAHPWLAAASILLLLVSLLVAAVLVWTATETRMGRYFIFTGESLAVIGAFDLVISLLIAAVAVLLGQGITSYELFTGKSLPRQTLARQWKRAIGLAIGYGVLMGGALAGGLEPEYAVLMTAVLMTVFFALLSWRYYVEWENNARQLRPFVTSAHWYERLVAAPEQDAPVDEPFAALCEQVLNASLAYLIPTGAAAPFVAPHAYPAGRTPPVVGPDLALPAPHEAPLAWIDPAAFDGACWAVPLRRERGLIGVLLLGPRRDGGLYTREEIEIAQAAGERLIDSAAGVELSRRLMRLQRQRMAATQHLDQRTRRVLHDEVLPLIHTAILHLAAGAGGEAALRQLTDAHQQLSNLLRDLPAAAPPHVARLGLLPALRAMVDGEFGPSFDAVEWRWPPAVEQETARLSPLATETVYYAAREIVRNAAKYARPAGETAPLRLLVAAAVEDGRLALTIEDNGRGAARPASHGHGLELHSTLMAIAGGSLSIETIPHHMTRVCLLMPVPADRGGGSAAVDEIGESWQTVTSSASAQRNRAFERSPVPEQPGGDDPA